MASPTLKFPEIINAVKDLGYKSRCPTDMLEKEIIRMTGITRPETLKRTVSIMEMLGYIVQRGNTTVLLSSQPDNAIKIQK